MTLKRKMPIWMHRYALIELLYDNARTSVYELARAVGMDGTECE